MERCSFWIDGVEALDAPLDARLDVVFAQLLGECVFDAAQELLALDAAGFDGLRDLLVADGIGVAEGQVFKLAADFAHAQAMGERGVDVEGLAGDGLLAVGLEVLQGAHVVQAVGQLDQHHAHIGDHGQQHLADVFGLAVFAIGELDFVDLGDALDDVGHLVAEAGFDFFAGGGGVFDGVVQQAGGDGGRVHLHLGQHFGHLKRMNDVGLAGGAHLALVVLDAELPGFANEADVFTGAVGLDLAEKCLETLVDGILVGNRTDRLGRPRTGWRRWDIGRMGCRTVAMLHYRPNCWSMPQWSAEERLSAGRRELHARELALEVPRRKPRHRGRGQLRDVMFRRMPGLRDLIDRFRAGFRRCQSEDS